MPRTICEEQVAIRMSGLLRAELEAAAAEDGRPLAAQIRKVLVEWAAERVTSRGRIAAAA